MGQRIIQGNCSMETRVCTSCKQELPATDEYFHWQKTKQGKRLRAVCKVCRNASENARCEADKERILEYHRLRYVDNPEPKKTYARQRRIDKPEVVREEQRLYRLNNWGKLLAGKREYARKKPEIKRLSTLKRRARLKRLGGSLASQDIKNLWIDQEGRCAYCGKSILEKYHIDHVLSIKQGGRNDLSNIVLTCVRCNCSKKDTPLAEWMLKKFG